jgi:transposase InsO family protein
MSKWFSLKNPGKGIVPFSAPKSSKDKKELENYLAYETSRGASKHFPRRADVETFYGQRWQMDVADIGGNISFNLPAAEKKPKLYALLMIDLFSRTIRGKSLPGKSATTTAEALEYLLKNTQAWERPRVIESDAGGEFRNAKVQGLLKDKFNIELIIRGGIHKNEVIERAVRSFKKVAVLYLETHTDTLVGWKEKWEKLVPRIIALLNHRTNRNIHWSPEEVVSHWRQVQKVNIDRMNIVPFDEYLSLQEALVEGKPIKDGAKKFSLNDWVLVRHEKHAYDKETVRNYLTKPWQIKFIAVDRRPFTYVLKDEDGHPAKRAFYARELRKLKRNPLKGDRPIKNIVKERTLPNDKKEWLVQFLDDKPHDTTWIPAKKELIQLPRHGLPRKRGRPRKQPQEKV